MEAEDLIKKQREQIEELQKLLANGTLDPEKLNDTMGGMKSLLTPQIAQMNKVAEQMKEAGKGLLPMVEFLNSEIGKEALKKYFKK